MQQLILGLGVSVPASYPKGLKHGKGTRRSRTRKYARIRPCNLSET